MLWWQIRRRSEWEIFCVRRGQTVLSLHNPGTTPSLLRRGRREDKAKEHVDSLTEFLFRPLLVALLHSWGTTQVTHKISRKPCEKMRHYPCSPPRHEGLQQRIRVSWPKQPIQSSPRIPTHREPNCGSLVHSQFSCTRRQTIAPVTRTAGEVSKLPRNVLKKANRPTATQNCCLTISQWKKLPKLDLWQTSFDSSDTVWIPSPANTFPLQLCGAYCWHAFPRFTTCSPACVLTP